jgi:hypothetical protein
MRLIYVQNPTEGPRIIQQHEKNKVPGSRIRRSTT